MVLGGGAFGRWLGHEDGALMNGISALRKATPGSFLTPSSPRSQTYKLQDGEKYISVV